MLVWYAMLYEDDLEAAAVVVDESTIERAFYTVESMSQIYALLGQE
jgi:hypothetical protein